MQIESIAEGHETFCNTFGLHLAAIINLEKQILVFFLSGRLRYALLHVRCLQLGLMLVLIRKLKPFDKGVTRVRYM